MKIVQLSAILILSACMTKEKRVDYISILIDKSDSMRDVDSLSTDKVISDLDLWNNLWSGANVKMRAITDLRHNSETVIKIQPENRTFSNEIARKKAIKEFKVHAGQTLDKLKTAPIGRNRSVIFEALQHECQMMCKVNNASLQRILVFSDLQQNTRQYSIYDKSRPPLTSEYFAEHYPIQPAIGDISIVFIHEPKNQFEDEVYDEVSMQLSEYLTSIGYKVEIRSNL